MLIYIIWINFRITPNWICNKATKTFVKTTHEILSLDYRHKGILMVRHKRILMKDNFYGWQSYQKWTHPFFNEFRFAWTLHCRDTSFINYKWWMKSIETKNHRSNLMTNKFSSAIHRCLVDLFRCRCCGFFLFKYVYIYQMIDWMRNRSAKVRVVQIMAHTRRDRAH